MTDDKAGVEEAGAEKAGVERAGVEKAGIEKAGVEQAGIEKAGAEKAGTEKAGVEQADFEKAGFETRAIHAGQPPDPVTGAVVPPISLSTTFAQAAVGEHRGYDYARSGNPTRTALESCLADLEGAAQGLAFASGLAAEDAVLRLLAPGDHVVFPADAYGGTFRLIDKVWGPAGLSHTPADLTSPVAIEAAWRESTRLVWIETPSNPLLSIVDIAAVADFAHRRGALVVVDNTFATPYLQRPLSLGADVVVHSATKYLGGHSDVVGGFLAVSDPELGERLAFFQNAVGAVPGPMDCYLVMRGIKTLGVRMDRHCSNAWGVAVWLAAHPKVGEVRYPGLPGHPGHEVAERQMAGFGGMVSFTLAAGEAAALEVARSTSLWTLAESLGAVESLIEHPGRMTHASTTGSALQVDPALIRLSVGIETLDDLLADLEHALDRIG
ncbi:MAG TPA: cystathionine gamma-synthase [Acidimicrobiales bacterium]|jgi:cystathionine gamma-synthase|nr:cystathionine gamma-synthase [Acidimicrobiales bacterium]